MINWNTVPHEPHISLSPHMERIEFRPRAPRGKRPRESGSFVLQPLLSTSTNAVKAEMEEQEESSLTYGCLSSTVPFERLYMSKKRTGDPLQNMVSFPPEYVVRETFQKVARTENDPDTVVSGIFRPAFSNQI